MNASVFRILLSGQPSCMELLAQKLLLRGPKHMAVVVVFYISVSETDMPRQITIKTARGKVGHTFYPFIFYFFFFFNLAWFSSFLIGGGSS